MAVAADAIVTSKSLGDSLDLEIFNTLDLNLKTWFGDWFWKSHYSLAHTYNAFNLIGQSKVEFANGVRSKMFRLKFALIHSLDVWKK